MLTETTVSKLREMRLSVMANALKDQLADAQFQNMAFEARHVQRYVAGGGREVSVIVAASVVLTGFIALIAGDLRQFLRFLLQQLVQCFLHAASDQFLKLPLDNFLVELYNLLRHSLLALFRIEFNCSCKVLFGTHTIIQILRKYQRAPLLSYLIARS